MVPSPQLVFFALILQQNDNFIEEEEESNLIKENLLMNYLC